VLQQRDIGLIKAQGVEKRRFAFPNCMRFREQIGAQFLGWNVRLEAIGKLHRCFYILPDLSNDKLEPDAGRSRSTAPASGSAADAGLGALCQ
jgi:hypothetical protein